MNFKELNLDSRIQKALSENGYEKPTEIQQKAIPIVERGCDVRASAQTGTGKTAAFLLPALSRIATQKPKSGRGPRVLILAPTRELAVQIQAQAIKYSKYLQKLNTVCVSGGMPFPPQLRQLAKPYEILVATPGRLIDLMQKKKIEFSRLELLVLDEADRMLDMGFFEPVKRIVSKTPKERQTLLFSATLEGSVSKLSEYLLDSPVDIVIHSAKQKHENIEQKLHYTDDVHHKNRLLDHLLNEEISDSSIVFTSTKRHADKLSGELYEKGFNVGRLHGDMNQRQRTKTIAKFKSGKIKTLVATDVAARGIDVQSISHVINFDLPRNIEDYVHRIGRTGRAGAKGVAFSFAAGNEKGLVRQIEKFTGQPINTIEIPGFEHTKKDFSSPSNKKRSPRKNRGGRKFAPKQKFSAKKPKRARSGNKKVFAKRGNSR